MRRAVKMENAYVHEVSAELTRKRDAWRRRREQVSRSQRDGGDAASRHLQAELKVYILFRITMARNVAYNDHVVWAVQAEGQALNHQAEQLNDLVKQIRKSQAWVTERERKLDHLEKLHINSDKMKGV